MDDVKRKAVNRAFNLLKHLMYDKPDYIKEIEKGYMECRESGDTSDFIGGMERLKIFIEEIIEDMKYGGS